MTSVNVVERTAIDMLTRAIGGTLHNLRQSYGDYYQSVIPLSAAVVADTSVVWSIIYAIKVGLFNPEEPKVFRIKFSLGKLDGFFH